MKFLGWLLLGLLAGAFMIHPAWDLQAASFFYRDGGFVLGDSIAAKFISKANHNVAVLCGVFFAVGLGLTVLRHRPWLGLGLPAYGFLLTSLIMGPGLVTNALLKDHWGRARPAQVQEFGGTHSFTPAGIISDQCDRNCSFVCGDAAFVFWMVALAYVVPPRHSLTITLLAFGAGALDGALRMAQGGHFLSDVLFAAWFMILMNALCHAVWFGLPLRRLRRHHSAGAE
jgi:lipid A 4'-phosphatase